MEKERLFKLTCALYRVTELLPETEPLRILIREKALAVLFEQGKKQENIETLLDAFELAQEQAWLGEENFLILAQGYQEIKDSQPKKVKKQEKTRKGERKDVKMPQRGDLKISRYRDFEISNGDLKARQEKVVEILEQEGEMQVGDLEKMFPEVTKRTLRRDMVELTNRGVLERVGQGIRTFYRIKKRA